MNKMTNEKIVNSLIEGGYLKSENIIDAFRVVDRADFVRSSDQRLAYKDEALSIGYGGTISQPSTVAIMLELLRPRKGDAVLDVGSGSGWTTALLSHVFGEKGKVIGVDIVPELVEFGKENLEKYNLENTAIQEGRKDVRGWPEDAPYDKILVSASVDDTPEDIIEQLKPGGVLVAPIQHTMWKIKKLEDGTIEKEELEGLKFAFVPLQ